MDIIYRTDNYKFDILFLKFGDRAFPWDAWDDFITDILCDWIYTLVDLKKPCCDFRLYFMDGPYYLLCTKNFDLLSIVGVSNDKAIELFGEIEFCDFVDKLLSTVMEIVNDAKSKSVWNDYLDSLSYALEVGEQHFNKTGDCKTGDGSLS